MTTTTSPEALNKTGLVSCGGNCILFLISFPSKNWCSSSDGVISRKHCWIFQQYTTRLKITNPLAWSWQTSFSTPKRCLTSRKGISSSIKKCGWSSSTCQSGHPSFKHRLTIPKIPNCLLFLLLRLPILKPILPMQIEIIQHPRQAIKGPLRRNPQIFTQPRGCWSMMTSNQRRSRCWMSAVKTIANKL